MIKIEAYCNTWPEEFNQIKKAISGCLGPLAIKIDHIGSTAVPGLAAKNVIDVQVTVAELDEEVKRALITEGFVHRVEITRDHYPPGVPENPQLWKKWVFQEPEGKRRVNIHVRVAGNPNQKYPLLCRDYLRAHPKIASAYAQAKFALASLHPDNEDAYYSVKDPIFDILIGGAELWITEKGIH